MRPGDHPISSSTQIVDFPDDTYFLVWTTTPWTLPANLAIAVHPEVQYAKVSYQRNGQNRIGIIDADICERFCKRANIYSFNVEITLIGKDLLSATYLHPFINRTGRLLAADYVTT